MQSSHYGIVALLFHTWTVFGDKQQQNPQMRGKPELDPVSDGRYV